MRISTRNRPVARIMMFGRDATDSTPGDRKEIPIEPPPQRQQASVCPEPVPSRLALTPRKNPRPAGASSSQRMSIPSRSDTLPRRPISRSRTRPFVLCPVTEEAAVPTAKSAAPSQPNKPDNPNSRQPSAPPGADGVGVTAGLAVLLPAQMINAPASTPSAPPRQRARAGTAPTRRPTTSASCAATAARSIACPSRSTSITVMGKEWPGYLPHAVDRGRRRRGQAVRLVPRARQRPHVKEGPVLRRHRRRRRPALQAQPRARPPGPLRGRRARRGTSAC